MMMSLLGSRLAALRVTTAPAVRIADRSKAVNILVPDIYLEKGKPNQLHRSALYRRMRMLRAFPGAVAHGRWLAAPLVRLVPVCSASNTRRL